MKNAYEALRMAATASLHALGSPDSQLRARVVRELEDALALDQWIAVTPQTMPEERVRVIASFGTCVVDDCFYGYGSSSRAPVHGHKLWRETSSERPLAFVPNVWMPLPRSPAAPFAGRFMPVHQQVVPETEPATALA